MSEHIGATQTDIDQANYFQKQGMGKANAPDLPAWVKCMYCGGRPVWGDLLGEVIPHSSALAHQSCMKARGKLFGLNAGTMAELGDVTKSPEGAKQ